MQITINIPDNLPQAIVMQQIKEFEEKLTQQATQEVAGSLSHYAKSYIPTPQATSQAWQEIINEKYHST